MEWIDRYVDGFVKSWRSNSSLSIDLSSSDHLSVGYIDACICEDSIKFRFASGGFILGGLGGSGKDTAASRLVSLQRILLY